VKIREVVDSAFVVINTSEGTQRIKMLREHRLRVTESSVHTCMVILYGVQPVIQKKKYRGEVD
jgi:hypothetical protein